MKLIHAILITLVALLLCSSVAEAGRCRVKSRSLYFDQNGSAVCIGRIDTGEYRILTAAHLFEGAEFSRAKLTVQIQEQWIVSRPEFIDRDLDLATVLIRTSLPVVETREWMNTPPPLTPVYWYDFEGNVHHSRTISEDMIEGKPTDGSSGGPILDRQHRLIGVMSAYATLTPQAGRRPVYSNHVQYGAGSCVNGQCYPPQNRYVPEIRNPFFIDPSQITWPHAVPAPQPVTRQPQQPANVQHVSVMIPAATVAKFLNEHLVQTEPTPADPTPAKPQTEPKPSAPPAASPDVQKLEVKVQQLQASVTEMRTSVTNIQQSLTVLVERGPDSVTISQEQLDAAVTKYLRENPPAAEGQVTEADIERIVSMRLKEFGEQVQPVRIFNADGSYSHGDLERHLIDSIDFKKPSAPAEPK